MSTDWHDIEQAAREQVSAELIAETGVPLEYGRHIAWAIAARVGRATDSLSLVHRVGVPQKGDDYTTCGEPIPAPALRLSLGPAMLRRIDRCRFCAAEIARHAVEAA